MQNKSRASDAELWREACRGDAAAFGLMFERHYRAVYNHAFRRTGNWFMAEEICSLVFLEAWRRRKGVQLTRDSALPWLLGTANHLLLNAWRSRRRYRAALNKLSAGRQDDFSHVSDERIDDVRRLEHVTALIKDLPPKQREILELVVWDELDYEQAAVAAQIPVGTVRSRLARARERLAKLEAGNPQAERTVESLSVKKEIGEVSDFNA